MSSSLSRADPGEPGQSGAESPMGDDSLSYSLPTPVRLRRYDGWAVVWAKVSIPKTSNRHTSVNIINRAELNGVQAEPQLSRCYTPVYRGGSECLDHAVGHVKLQLYLADGVTWAPPGLVGLVFGY